VDENTAVKGDARWQAPKEWSDEEAVASLKAVGVFPQPLH